MMNSERYNQLLNDSLVRDEAADFRRDLLESGLRHLRRKRRGRKVAKAGLAVAALAAAVRLVVGNVDDEPVQIAAPGYVTPPSEVASDSSPAVEVIGDKELQEMFPDKVLALIGPPGEQRLLILEIPDQRL